MGNVDLRKLALRLKVTEMIRLYVRRRLVSESAAYWRTHILPN